MFLITRSSHRRRSVRKSFIRNFVKFTGKHLRQSLFLKNVAGTEEETLEQVFSCEFYEISKNTFFTEHLWKTASELLREKNDNVAFTEHVDWRFFKMITLRKSSRFF